MKICTKANLHQAIPKPVCNKRVAGEESTASESGTVRSAGSDQPVAGIQNGSSLSSAGAMIRPLPFPPGAGGTEVSDLQSPGN
mmetsp:Transcript_113841/g.367840  ORF Transcript_113841/g.367840 Transcript_113841/m.367840 type:complete len:83 (-) Transcript_113841:139-387(-)